MGYEKTHRAVHRKKGAGKRLSGVCYQAEVLLQKEKWPKLPAWGSGCKVGTPGWSQTEDGHSRFTFSRAKSKAAWLGRGCVMLQGRRCHGINNPAG